MRVAAWLGTMGPSFGFVAETLSQVAGVWISTSTVWRCHKEVAEQQRQVLTKQEQELTDWGGEAEEEKERVAAGCAVGEKASVSVDGALIRIREERYREVKMPSVLEVREGGKRSKKRTSAGAEEEGVQLGGHSYRPVLGEEGAFEPGLRAELVRRRVMDASEIASVNMGRTGSGAWWGVTCPRSESRCWTGRVRYRT